MVGLAKSKLSLVPDFSNLETEFPTDKKGTGLSGGGAKVVENQLT